MPPQHLLRSLRGPIKSHTQNTDTFYPGKDLKQEHYKYEAERLINLWRLLGLKTVINYTKY